MIEFLANRIYKEDDVSHAMVLEDELVIFNFNLVYGIQKTASLLKTIKEKNENCYFISRFGDYVGFFRFQTDSSHCSCFHFLFSIFEFLGSNHSCFFRSN